MPARRLSMFAIVALCSLQALAEGSADRLSSMAGTWDVTQRMWPSPGAEAISLAPAIAERRLVRGTYLEEVMTPASDGQPGSFSRNAFINFNPVSSKYEYTSLDSRAPQLMVEQSERVADPARSGELKLKGSSFTAPQWGNAKNVRFTYRLTLGAIENNQQTVRLYLTPQTVLPKKEFLAFEYVYSKRQ